MRAKETLETLIAFPLAILMLVTGIHIQHNPTGRAARALERFLKRRNA
ncbi:MAG: hypothetical protein KAS36_08675 [Anaerolineales bacterium]|nr:hypothetical protein [Anaerolineales bacterium]